jgi:hypothetical protein
MNMVSAIFDRSISVGGAVSAIIAFTIFSMQKEV